MDWLNKTWESEDALYGPKRKVNNKGSHEMNHIIGGFRSLKMGRVIEYESLGERLIFYYLELDKSTVRYYPQPVQVPLIKSAGSKSSASHVPDGLVFRQGRNPILFQVKDKPGELSEIEQFKNEACLQFAGTKGWEYEVIYPKTMPHPLPRNLRFLKSFLVSRPYYQALSSIVLYRLQCVGHTTISELSQLLDDHMDHLSVIPLIYHLIAHGVLDTDITKEVGPESDVQVNEVGLMRYDFLPIRGEKIVH